MVLKFVNKHLYVFLHGVLTKTHPWWLTRGRTRARFFFWGGGGSMTTSSAMSTCSVSTAPMPASAGRVVWRACCVKLLSSRSSPMWAYSWKQGKQTAGSPSKAWNGPATSPVNMWLRRRKRSSRLARALSASGRKVDGPRRKSLSTAVMWASNVCTASKGTRPRAALQKRGATVTPKLSMISEIAPPRSSSMATRG